MPPRHPGPAAQRSAPAPPAPSLSVPAAQAPASAVTADRTSIIPLAGLLTLLLVYLAIGGLYALYTPAWQVPDEPAHYNYIRHIAETGSLPVLQPGDYDAAYLEELKARRFPPELPVDTVRYESWQPPLYYLLAAPIFALSGGSLAALRLFSLLLGAGVVAATWLLARAALPGRPWLPLAAAGFVAFIPQHLAILAGVNNDALAELVIALSLWLAVAALLRPGAAPAPLAFWPLGLLLGLGFLTKLSTYPLAALFAFMLLLKARREGWGARGRAAAAAVVYLPALALGAMWWGRNLAVYGGLDFLAMARHDQVVVGQLRPGEALALWGSAGYVQRFFQTTFQSFWGQFGWMGVVMDARVYLALLLYSALLAAGALGALWAARRRGGLFANSARRDVLALLLVHALLTLAVYLYYNLGFVQFQGRYLYPALPVLALAAAVALDQWARWLLSLWRRPPAALAPVAAALPVAILPLMAVLDLFALYRFIIPALAVP